MSYKTQYPKDAPELIGFKMPFAAGLDAGNELVRLADMIPWGEIEEHCKDVFAEKGRKAYPVRVAVGAILLKEIRRVPGDRPLVELIRENPYAQYFLGFSEFLTKAPFDQSLMPHFRARLEPKMARINELVLKAQARDCAESTPDGNGGDGGPGSPENRGQLIVDATVAPADIAYPTDNALVFQAIGQAYAAIERTDAVEGLRRPYSRLKKAHEVYLSVAKAKKMKRSKRAKKMRFLVECLGQYLDHLDVCMETPTAFASEGPAARVTLGKTLETLRKVHGQQKEMLDEKKHSVKDRIVSLAQHWVRPMVRGKLRAKTEFGIKVSAAVTNGYVRFEEASFDPYNEAQVLQSQIENYKDRNGCYPESVHADQIYLNRDNRRFCKEKAIRLSGRPLGRPKTDRNGQPVSDTLYRQDLKDRIQVEGKFGEAKRTYSLDRVMAHLKETTITVLHAVAITMNLKRWLKALLSRLLQWLACLAFGGLHAKTEPLAA